MTGKCLYYHNDKIRHGFFNVWNTGPHGSHWCGNHRWTREEAIKAIESTKEWNPGSKCLYRIRVILKKGKYG